MREIIAQQRRAHAYVTKGIAEDIERLHELDHIARIREFLGFGTLYVAGAVLAGYGMLATVVGVVFMGLAVNSLSIFIHEGLHGLFSKNKRINHAVSFLVGMPILMSATAYKVMHTDHHIELGNKPDFGTYKQHTATFGVWLASFAQLIVGSFLYVLLMPFLSLRNPRHRLAIIIEYVVVGSLFALLIAFAPARTVIVYWLLPMCILNALTNIRGLAAHALADESDIYLSSRSVRASRPMAMLFLHENYHLEHHLFPQVPSYHLEDLHRLIWPRLPRALYERSYLSFLITFFRAAARNDLSPQRLVYPRSRSTL